ncbi:hypothetical protein RFI_22707 [Reticulomyxa filosa]|uniref:Coatomer subunit gamma n=1 Tax=Reticulomyxa filosa TaxID=46433 RepID=X6MNI3_RETFI|nr:hypothetical protein RFI_22707 [Reticulomyxa filosa]|eukprot:ETO14660.1 hypothetical protein RFI_22707 [Reticulomyxa filosa]
MNQLTHQQTKKCLLFQTDIRILLKRSLEDEDDEVRDRATLFSAVLHHCEFDQERLAIIEAKLQENKDDLQEAYLRDEEARKNETSGQEPTDEQEHKSSAHISTTPPPEELVSHRNLIGFVDVPSIEWNLKDMETALLNYLKTNNDKQENGDKNAFVEAFDVSKISTSPADVTDTEVRRDIKTEKDESKLNVEAISQPVDLYGDQNLKSEEYLQFLESVKKDLPDLGNKLCTGRIQALSEPEAEYQADVVKHIYAKYIVLQVNIHTTMENQLLTDLYLEVDYEESEISTIPCPSIRANETGISLVIIERQEDDNEYLLGKFECSLKFTVKDAAAENPEFEEGFEDTYQLNELSFTHLDYISPVYDISQIEFKQQWTELESVTALQKQGQLSFATLQDAVDHTISRLGLSAVEDSNVTKEGVPTHVVNLVGRLAPDIPILLRIAFGLENKSVNYRVCALF